MPFCSALATARVLSSSSFTRRPASSSTMTCIASRIRMRRRRLRPPPRLENIPWICEVSSSMPGGARISICGCAADTSMSISLSSSSPSRSLFLNFCRVTLSSSVPLNPTSTSRMRSSAASSARARPLHRLLAGLLDADLDEVAHDGVDIAADVADLGELGRLDLDERRVGQAREAPRDLGLADARGPDHQDVLRRDLLAQRLGHLLAPPAVAQRDRHGALGPSLPDDVLVQLMHDLLRSHAAHHRPFQERNRDRPRFSSARFLVTQGPRWFAGGWCKCKDQI